MWWLFKAHVNTPSSGRMFGSLVVCLPTQFSGRDLIVCHHKQEIKYDWSSTASDTSSTLHWAAFFSDIEHEVLSVSEGYKVTLICPIVLKQVIHHLMLNHTVYTNYFKQH